MAYQVLARKWRPKKYADVIGQSHITQSIQNALKTEKVGHAYLMVGTRGVGKTTVARLFARSLRCENLTETLDACGKCQGCQEFDADNSMNVVEIDGASNNSVDNIRDLISNVQFLPTSGDKKVYIIDEVHMLSNSAFNALLKTLEEPPAHVVFILATTEAHKLLGTVLSRCQRFDFRNISNTDLQNHLKAICNVESISIQEHHLNSLAKLGKGSARDTLSLLDQCLAYSLDNKITDEVMQKALGIASFEMVNHLMKALYLGHEVELRKIYNQFLFENIPLKNIIESVLDEVFKHLENFEQRPNFVQIISKPELVWIFESIAKETEWCFNSLVPEKTVELILVKVTLRREFFSDDVKTTKQVEKKTEILKNDEKISTQEQLTTKITPKIEEIKPSIIQSDLTWSGFLKFLSTKAPASSSNLEQGNLVDTLIYDKKNLNLEIGFNQAGKVFYDYLNEQSVTNKIIGHLADFFNVLPENVNLKFTLLTDEAEFKSTAEIREEEDRQKEENRISDIKNNILIKQAEKIFNSKIDKVIIDKKK